MKFRPGRVREEPEINLVPLIDVMMVILIFLMITTTYSKYTELQINLPNEIAVLVNPTGQYVIDKAPVTYSTIAALASDLRRAGGERKDPVIVISADALSSHQSVVRVMEAARVAGYAQITFTTQATGK